MIAYALRSPLGWIGREEVADLVGHGDETVKSQNGLIVVVRRGRAQSAHAISNAFCFFLFAVAVSGACSTRVTSTAVTLYSGQFVAQSERSEVTQFTHDLA